MSFLLPESQEVTMEAEAKPDDGEPLCESAEKVDSDGTPQTEDGNSTTQDSSIINGGDADGEQEMVDLKIIWNKIKYDLKIPLDSSGAKLKEAIHSLTGKWSEASSRRPVSNSSSYKPENGEFVVTPSEMDIDPLPLPFPIARSSPRNAESHVQGIASRGQDAARDQNNKRCESDGGGVHHERRAGGEHAQRDHPAGGQGWGEQKRTFMQSKGEARFTHPQPTTILPYKGKSCLNILS